MRGCSEARDGAEKKAIDDGLGSFAGDAAQQPMERAMRPRRKKLYVVEGRKYRNRQEKKRLRTHKAGAP